MRKTIVLAFAISALSLSLTAAQDGGVSIMVQEHEEHGRHLTDSEGRNLYLFTRDERGGASTCYDACAENWPPLIVSDVPTAGAGAAASLLGTLEREDGSLQATYYGWPLYYFARDEQPGDAAGHGVNDVWFLVSPYGEAIAAPQSAAAQAEQAGGENRAAGQEAEGAQAQGEDIPGELMASGRTVFTQFCAGCHGAEGAGGSGPALAGNSRLQNESLVLRQILKGGNFMPAFGGALTDEQVAAVSTFVRNSWGNDFGLTTSEEVSEAR